MGAALLASCATSRTVGRQPSSHAAYGTYLRGLMLERASKLPEALNAYRFALEHDPHSALLHVHLGATYVKLGQTDRALQAFAQALDLDPNQPDALRWMAMLATSQGQIEKAIAAYERLLTLEPTDQFVMSTLADLYVLQGTLPRAVPLYQRLIEEAGSSSQLHFNLGVLYGRLNRFDDAIQELSRAFELSPD